MTGITTGLPVHEAELSLNPNVALFEGRLYSMQHLATTIATATPVNFRFTVGDRPVVVFGITVTVKKDNIDLTAQTFEGATFGTAGTALSQTALNLIREAPPPFATAEVGTAVTDDGTPRAPWAVGENRITLQGLTALSMLPAGEDILLRVTNNDATARDVLLNIVAARVGKWSGS